MSGATFFGAESETLRFDQVPLPSSYDQDLYIFGSRGPTQRETPRKTKMTMENPSMNEDVLKIGRDFPAIVMLVYWRLSE